VHVRPGRPFPQPIQQCHIPDQIREVQALR
jgi:hypothetical protein